MMATTVVFVSVVLSCVGLLSTYPTGAPTCAAWRPKHANHVPQPDPSPYTISVSSASVMAGQSIDVTLSGIDGKQFKGFQMRALDTSSGEESGNFADGDDDGNGAMYHTLPCDKDTPKGAITHNDATVKPSIRATWIAPANAAVVVFTATVVKQYSTFWINVKSAEVTVIGSVTSPSPSPSTSQSSSSSPSPSSDVYTGCGVTKSCFGMPGGDLCIGPRNCHVLATFVKRPTENIIDFELMGKVTGPDSYIAIGFSNDSVMGDDSVRECVIKSDDISGSESYNLGKSNMIVAPMDLSAKSFVDGVLDCKFSLNTSFVTRDVSFDLIAYNYHVLLAQGSLAGQGKMSQHAERLPSVNAFNFSMIETGKGTSINTLVAIHGSLMILSWVGMVSVAIFLARYYKQMWPDTTFCKVRVWFAWHRALNTLVVLMSSAAFVIIFVHVNGWSNEWPANPHPVTGTITFGLMLLQPIMALFRCDPGSSRRPIFNWLHFLVGMVAVILAIVTMFYAVTLHAVDLPQYFWWILIAYVAFFVISFANMEFFTCIGARAEEKESIAMQSYPIGSGNAHTGNSNPPMAVSVARQARFKEVMLIVFVAAALGFSAALVVVVVTS